jgi:hypothetical protein
MRTLEPFALGCDSLGLKKSGVDGYSWNVIIFEESYLRAPLDRLSRQSDRGWIRKLEEYLLFHFFGFTLFDSLLGAGSRSWRRDGRIIVYDHGLVKLGKKNVKVNLSLELKRKTLPSRQPSHY